MLQIWASRHKSTTSFLSRVNDRSLRPALPFKILFLITLFFSLMLQSVKRVVLMSKVQSEIQKPNKLNKAITSIIFLKTPRNLQSFWKATWSRKDNSKQSQVSKQCQFSPGLNQSQLLQTTCECARKWQTVAQQFKSSEWKFLWIPQLTKRVRLELFIKKVNPCWGKLLEQV